MKYLVVKGWLGFGDRLESLKMGIHFAIENKLQIYVDWNDSMWTHSTENFYTYFKLENMPLLNSLDDIPKDASYYPEFWKDNIKLPLTHELIENKSLNIGILSSKTKDADVIVLSSIGRRTLYYDSTFFANVFRVIEPKVIEVVNQRQLKYNLKNCYGIHVRGTDRVTKSRDIPVQYLVIKFVGLAHKQMIVVSDDIQSFNIWKRYYPDSILLSDLSIKESLKQGNHNVSKEGLKTSKHELTVDALIDFFTLASCYSIQTTYADSRFCKEAGRLHQHIDKLI
jgi:hypothetical protein